MERGREKERGREEKKMENLGGTQNPVDAAAAAAARRDGSSLRRPPGTVNPDRWRTEGGRASERSGAAEF